MSKAAPKKTHSGSKTKNTQAVRPAPKPKRPPMPTLPQHEVAAPYDRLLKIGESDKAEQWYEEIAAELRQRDTQEAVARLTAIALDETFEEYWSEANPVMDDSRPFARVHAVGVLTQLGEAAHPAIEPLLPLLDTEDDWLREEMPVFYAAIGQPAVEPLRRILQNADLDTYLRTGAGDSLEQIGEQHAELRPTVVPLLEEALLSAGQDDLFAAFLVCNLLDLNAKESLPLIQQAFAEDRVDLSVVGMEDVEEHFGLPSSRIQDASRIQEGEADTEARDSGEEWEGGGDGQGEFSSPQPFDTPQPYVKPVKLGRNEPCWCGSGKKFKQCHG